eukprot:12218987-Prorocentrum_lima.AAC.1
MDTARQAIVQALTQSSIFVTGAGSLQFGSGSQILLDDTGCLALIVSNRPLPPNIPHLPSPAQLPPLPQQPPPPTAPIPAVLPT